MCSTIAQRLLILRLAMTDYPFAYKSAIKNAYSSFIYNRDFAKLLPYLLNERGIINIGKKRQSILDFAKKDNPKIKGIKILRNKDFPIDSSINVSKFNNLIKKYVKKSSNFQKIIKNILITEVFFKRST